MDLEGCQKHIAHWIRGQILMLKFLSSDMMQFLLKRFSYGIWQLFLKHSIRSKILHHTVRAQSTSSCLFSYPIHSYHFLSLTASNTYTSYTLSKLGLDWLGWVWNWDSASGLSIGWILWMYFIARFDNYLSRDWDPLSMRGAVTAKRVHHPHI